MADITNEPIVVVSDIHLGTGHIEKITPPNRDEFKDFLRYFPEKLDDEPKHLVLNGDFDDLWRRNTRTITRENSDVYNLLSDLQNEKEIDVHYILGNHDWYARRDRQGEISMHNEQTYASEYKEIIYRQTHGTRYKFMHGHQFDHTLKKILKLISSQLDMDIEEEKVFDFLAEVDGDVFGNKMEEWWQFFKSNRSRFSRSPSIRWLQKNLNKRKWRRERRRLESQTKMLAVAESNRKSKLGVEPGGAMDDVRRDPNADWLCIGHTHFDGIVEDSNVTNGGVANSGTWKGGNSTFLVLKEEPTLWEWNNGQPHLKGEDEN